jgi:hypothetical protein
MLVDIEALLCDRRETHAPRTGNRLDSMTYSPQSGAHCFTTPGTRERLGNGAASHWNRSKRTRKWQASGALEAKPLLALPEGPRDIAHRRQVGEGVEPAASRQCPSQPA